MDSMYADMENIINRNMKSMFRDYMVRMLGPSPFVPKWPVSHSQAEKMADDLIEYMDTQPDGGLKIMDDFYRDGYSD